MKKIIIIFLFISFLYSQRPQVIIKVPIEDNFELKVIASCSLDTVDTTRFIFKYTLINLPTSGQPVRLFEITNDTSKFACEPADTTIVPPNWRKFINKTFWWADPNFPSNFLPGDTLSGFIYKTWRLPDVSYWYAEGKDTIVCPELWYEDTTVYAGELPWVEDSLKKIYYKKTPFGPGRYGFTLGSGPFPPMKSSWPWGTYPDSAFIHLRDRLNKCNEQGWLTSHAYEQILRMINQAEDHVSHGRLEQSKRTLTHLLRTIERLREQQKIKDEAFYVMYYRTKYVRDNLWYKSPGK
jgi:hypothetical protein